MLSTSAGRHRYAIPPARASGIGRCADRAKSLLYRNPNLTNVYAQDYYGMYNYAVLGLKS